VNPYQIKIQLSGATVQALQENGFSLVVFQPLQATPSGGLPVVWLQTKSLTTTITISWTPTYAAYIASSPVVANGMIEASSEVPLGMGDMMVVAQNGSASVETDGPADAMSILNNSTTQYSCGLAATTGDQVTPIAAFPLYPSSLDAFAPMAGALLLFQSYPSQPGQVLERSFAQGLLVNMTQTQVSASFDINTGWNTGGASWGTLVPPNTMLATVLIHRTPLKTAADEGGAEEQQE